MAIFKIISSWVVSREDEIEADNEKKAIEKIADMFNNGEILLAGHVYPDSLDHEIVDPGDPDTEAPGENCPFPNLVEFIAHEEGCDCAFDQPCRWGHRVENHAVYCHSPNPDMPRKCRRTWYTGGETRDEDCLGFEPNPSNGGLK